MQLVFLETCSTGKELMDLQSSRLQLQGRQRMVWALEKQAEGRGVQEPSAGGFQAFPTMESKFETNETRGGHDE